MSGKRAKAAFQRGRFVAFLVSLVSFAALVLAGPEPAGSIGGFFDVADVAKAGPAQNGQPDSKLHPGQYSVTESRGSGRGENAVSGENAVAGENAASGENAANGNRDEFGDLAPRREILINLPAFTLYLYEAGRLIRQYPIAVGRMVTPSSFGEYRIINRVVNPTWYPEGRDPVPPGPANPVGSRWLGISLDGYGIHGTNDPGSIGKAVSKGCIRMRNEDVEELTELVRIGTPVRLAYETIVVEPDRKGEQYTITVYPDIYRKGTNTLAELWSKVARQGIRTTIGDEQLMRILRAATGKPEALPLDIEVRVGGTAVSGGAFWSGGRLWLPLRAVAEAFGKKVSWEENGHKAILDGHRLEKVVVRSASGGGGRSENGGSGGTDGSGGLGGASGGRTLLAALDEVERILGVHSSYDQRAGSVNLLVPEIYADGEPLGIKGFWSKGMLYFPLFELADHLGAEMDWDLDLEQLRLAGSPVPATLINDIFYVPFYAVKDLPLGVDLRWEEE